MKMAVADYRCEKGEWMLSYRFMTMDMHMVGGMYGLTDRIMLMAMTSYRSLDMDHVTGGTPTLRVPYPMQLGTGTWDFKPALTAFDRRGRIGFGVQATAQNINKIALALTAKRKNSAA